MSSLVGNKPNQVPTNGDLGKLAFKDQVSAADIYPDAQPIGFKNRIINGAMVIDQRNAGASVSTAGYTIDRWSATNNTTGGAFTVQQSTTVPSVAFTNSIKWTTTTAASALGASDSAYISQWIEGYNCSDFGFGNASAIPVTLSFWVRSSLTGTFSISYKNSAANRGYAATYTINAADTWEFKTITVTMDTTGTWVGGNGAGLQVIFSLGAGSSRSATAGSWQALNVNGATGTTSVINTLNATFYVTGVQLEKGSAATSFDYRPYGTELALCQRYYEKSYNIDVAPATNTYVGRASVAAFAASGTQFDMSGATLFKVTKRAIPSIQYWRQTGTADVWTATGPAVGLGATFNVQSNTGSVSGFEVTSQVTSGISGMTTYAAYGLLGQWAASAEL